MNTAMLRSGNFGQCHVRCNAMLLVVVQTVLKAVLVFFIWYGSRSGAEFGGLIGNANRGFGRFVCASGAGRRV